MKTSKRSQSATGVKKKRSSSKNTFGRKKSSSVSQADDKSADYLQDRPDLISDSDSNSNYTASNEARNNISNIPDRDVGNKGADNSSTEEKGIFLNLLMSAAKEKNKTYEDVWKEKVKYFKNICKEGSEAHISGFYRKALEKYKEALEIIDEVPYQTFKIEEIDFIVLKFVICLLRINSGNYGDIIYAIPVLKEIEEKHARTLPSVYYLLGLAYQKLNREKTALEVIEKGLSFLDKDLQFQSQPYPQTYEIIPETKRDVLCNELKESLIICRTYHKPDAICRYAQCLKVSSHIIPSINIYYSDPDFTGYVTTTCESNCKINFHPCCWRSWKEEVGADSKKVTEKDVLGSVCFTEKCENESGSLSKIVQIDVIGKDGQIKNTIKQNIAKQIKSVNKKDIKLELNKEKPNVPVKKPKQVPEPKKVQKRKESVTKDPEAEVKNEAEGANEVDFSRKTDTKKVDTQTSNTTSKKVDTPFLNTVTKKVDPPKKIDASKKLEIPKKADVTKKIGPPKKGGVIAKKPDKIKTLLDFLQKPDENLLNSEKREKAEKSKTTVQNVTPKNEENHVDHKKRGKVDKSKISSVQNVTVKNENHLDSKEQEKVDKSRLPAVEDFVQSNEENYLNPYNLDYRTMFNCTEPEQNFNFEVEFILSLFYEYLKVEGPQKKVNILKKWEEEKNDLDTHQFVQKNYKNICDLLLLSDRFCQEGAYISTTDQVHLAYQISLDQSEEKFNSNQKAEVELDSEFIIRDNFDTESDPEEDLTDFSDSPISDSNKLLKSTEVENTKDDTKKVVKKLNSTVVNSYTPVTDNANTKMTDSAKISSLNSSGSNNNTNSSISGDNSGTKKKPVLPSKLSKLISMDFDDFDLEDENIDQKIETKVPEKKTESVRDICNEVSVSEKSVSETKQIQLPVVTKNTEVKSKSSEVVTNAEAVINSRSKVNLIPDKVPVTSSATQTILETKEARCQTANAKMKHACSQTRALDANSIPNEMYQERESEIEELKEKNGMLEAMLVDSCNSNAELTEQIESWKDKYKKVMEEKVAAIERRNETIKTLKDMIHKEKITEKMLASDKKLSDFEELKKRYANQKKELDGQVESVRSLKEELRSTEKQLLSTYKEYSALLLNNFVEKYNEKMDALNKSLNYSSETTQPSKSQILLVKTKWEEAYSDANILISEFDEKLSELSAKVSTGERFLLSDLPSLPELNKNPFDPFPAVLGKLFEDNIKLAQLIMQQNPQAQGLLQSYAILLDWSKIGTTNQSYWYMPPQPRTWPVQVFPVVQTPPPPVMPVSNYVGSNLAYPGAFPTSPAVRKSAATKIVKSAPPSKPTTENANSKYGNNLKAVATAEKPQEAQEPKVEKGETAESKNKIAVTETSSEAEEKENASSSAGGEGTTEPKATSSGIYKSSAQDRLSRIVEDTKKVTDNKNTSSSFLKPVSSNLTPMPQSSQNSSSKITTYKLLAYLGKTFPKTNNSELEVCLDSVKKKNGGTLIGLDLPTLTDKIREQLKMQAKKVDSLMYVKFSGPAWGKLKDDRVDWNNEDANAECVICLEQITGFDREVLACKHEFHGRCIRAWLIEDSVCPTCKRPSLLPDEFPPLAS